MPANRRVRRSFTLGDYTFDVFVAVALCLAVAITLYPFLYVFSMSISDPDQVARGAVWLFPKGFSLKAFEVVLSEQGIYRAYANTIFYAAIGTALTILVTSMAAFPLARKRFVLRKFFSGIIIVPMFIGGGLIPSYILIRTIGIYDTMWAIILPGIVGAWNIIIVKTYMQYNIPESLIEAAKIDGMGDIPILFHIVFPLIKPVIAVIALYTIVNYWNSYFSVLLYIPTRAKQTLQIYLMRVLIQNSNDLTQAMMHRSARSDDASTFVGAFQLKYALIMFVILPIVTLYPFLQKYFVKGVLVGSLKG